MSREDFEGIREYAKEQHAKRVADNPNRIQYAIEQFEKQIDTIVCAPLNKRPSEIVSEY